MSLVEANKLVYHDRSGLRQFARSAGGRLLWQGVVRVGAGADAVISWWGALVLGAAGAFVADGSKLANVMLTSKRWPWSNPRQRWPLFVALAIRAGAGAAVSCVVAAQSIMNWSDQPLVLFCLGLSAPTVVQHGARISRAVIRAVMAEYFGSNGAGRGT